MGDADATAEITPRRLTTVVAADICGYSRLAETDESAAVRIVDTVYALFEKAVLTRRGRVFHRAGDGFLAEFPSASDGVLAALEFAASVRSRDSLAPNSLPARIRLGIHSGDVTERPDGDLLGHGVNIAARLQSEAAPDGVLVSLHTVNLVRGKIDVQFRRRGPLALKNIEEPIIAFDAAIGPRARFNILSDPFRRLRRHPVSALFLLAAIAAIIIAINGRLAIEPGKSGQPSALSAQVEMAVERSDSKSQISKDRFRAVVTDLLRSDDTVDQQTVASLMKGDLNAAYQMLWAKYRNEPGTRPPAENIEILHQAAVIMFDSHPNLSRNTYKKILDIAPDDFRAHERLGELLYQQSAGVESNSEFEQAFKIADEMKRNPERFRKEGVKLPSDEELINAKIRYATSLIVQQRFADADNMLKEAVAQARRLGFDSLVSRGKTIIANTQYNTYDYAAARQTIKAILPLQIRRNFTADRAISLGILGMMAYDEGDLGAADDYFEQSLALERKTGRALGEADMLFYTGMTKLDLGKLKSAQTKFDEGLNVSRKFEMRNMELKNLIGKSLLEQETGNQAVACSTLSRAENMSTPDIRYIAMTKKIIARIRCPFPPIGQTIGAVISQGGGENAPGSIPKPGAPN